MLKERPAPTALILVLGLLTCLLLAALPAMAGGRAAHSERLTAVRLDRVPSGR